MWKDIIVEEARKPGELLAKKYNYDVHKIFEYLRKQEKKHDKKCLVQNPYKKSVRKPILLFQNL